MLLKAKKGATTPRVNALIHVAEHGLDTKLRILQKILFALALLLGLLDSSCVVAQQRTLRSQLRTALDSVVFLPHGFIDPTSIVIRIDSSLTLSPGDYRFDTVNSSILLSPETRAILFPTGLTENIHQISIHYFQVPVDLQQVYTRHELRASDLADSIAASLDSNKRRGRPVRIVQTTDQSSDNPFLDHFQKSGSIARGFQLGSNRDLSLTSGFNLQFSGDLAKDVTISGALTEENTPIQPEGNTQTLHDVDRVYINMKVGQHLSATFGDFVLDLNEKDLGRAFQAPDAQNLQAALPTQSSARSTLMNSLSDVTFTNFSRKLLGVELGARYGTSSLMFSGATARGKYSTATFQGQESFQGPYQLTGKNGEPIIVVIAGTERVYVDGVLQIRGERNDYVIDYALGQVQFQPRRLITSASRISVDYQYTDEQYSRSFFAAEARTAIFDSVLAFTANFVREGDNQDAPLQVSLSDSDHTLLANAGNDPSKAAKSGVTVAMRTATGGAQGSYVKIDTIINGAHATAYVYTPLDTVNALYNVSFGFAGTGKGSYHRLAIGQYQFVGAGLGEYDTLVYLPLPQLTQVLDLVGTLHPFASLGLSGELASSQFTPNRFAAESLSDIAYTLRGAYLDTLRAGSAQLGTLEVRSLFRKINQNFTTIDRVDDVEFLRRYGLDQNPTQTGLTLPDNRETRSETSLTYSPLAPVKLSAGYGTLGRPAAGYKSQRYFGSAQLIEDSTAWPALFLQYERLPYTDTVRSESGLWHRALGDLGKTFHFASTALLLRGKYAFEERSASSVGQVDTLTSRSFRSTTWTPEATVRFSNRLSFGAIFEARQDDSLRLGALTPLSNAATTRLTASLIGIGGFSTSIDLTLRRKHYLDSSTAATAGGDESALLLRFEPRYATPERAFSVDGVYEISNHRAARLQRIFIPVQPGLGSYTYGGDLNHNGKQDPEEFVLARYSDQGTYVLINVPTTELFPTIDLRSSGRIHLDPAPLLPEQTYTGALWSILRSLSIESAVRVEETSTDPKENDIYFFRLSHFQNDSTTVHGTIEIDQDLFILANNPDQSYRLRFFERRGANQYNTGLERTYAAERSIRGRFRPTESLTNETTLAFTTDIAITNENSYNRPHSTSGTSLLTDWSYHPAFSSLDYGLHAEATVANERTQDPYIRAITTAFTARVGYALETKTRVRLELERDELTLANAPTDILLLPYSLTSGRSVGTTWLWKLALDYNIGSGILVTLSYDGRNATDPISGARATIHNGRAEIRASF